MYVQSLKRGGGQQSSPQGPAALSIAAGSFLFEQVYLGLPEPDSPQDRGIIILYSVPSSHRSP